MALGDAKSGRDVDPRLRPDSRLAFRRPGRQTHGAHRTQRIIFADVEVGCVSIRLPKISRMGCAHLLLVQRCSDPSSVAYSTSVISWATCLTSVPYCNRFIPV